jgi:hypothetical protein
LMSAINLALALANQGKHAEAAAMYRELLPLVRRVLGPEHPLTLVTADNLAYCSHAARSTPSQSA